MSWQRAQALVQTAAAEMGRSRNGLQLSDRYPIVGSSGREQPSKSQRILHGGFKLFIEHTQRLQP